MRPCVVVMIVYTATTVSSPLSEEGSATIAHGLTAYPVDSTAYQPHLLQSLVWYCSYFMRDRSPSLLPTEVATTEVMSNEAINLDECYGIGTVGMGTGGATAPSLNAPPSAAPFIAGVFDPTNLSPFLSAPTLNLTQDHRSLFQQYVQVGETAEQANKPKQKRRGGTGLMHSSKYIWQPWKSWRPKQKGSMKIGCQNAKLNSEKPPKGEVFASRTSCMSHRNAKHGKQLSASPSGRTCSIENHFGEQAEALDYLGVQFNHVLARREFFHARKLLK